MVTAVQLGEHLIDSGRMLAIAESCTGGWLAKVITDVPGSSAWFDRGFITYSNEAKQDMLGVRQETLKIHGAVSEATVEEMVRGVLSRSRAALAVSISGIAGPGGGTEEKPVGTVFMGFGWCGDDTGNPQVSFKRYQFSGERSEIRAQAVEAALDGLYACLLEALEGG